MHLIQKSAVAFPEILVTSFTLIISYILAYLDFGGRGESCKLSINMIVCRSWWCQQFAPIDKYLPLDMCARALTRACLCIGG
jgi:hypothetical protein